jgi:hypothetical protein
MAIRVKLNFEDRYEAEPVNGDLESEFKAPLEGGETASLKVRISTVAHELLPGVFNMAFGPSNGRGGIDDKAEITYKNYSRTFSTILFAGLIYLRNHKHHFLGIDGSNNARAYLYYRFLQHNFDYLDNYFNIYGLKYYVRITRFGKLQYDNPFDFEDIYPFPDKIYKGKEVPSDFMYNYFVFNLKQN